MDEIRTKSAAIPNDLLLTDLYQLNMVQAYLDNGLTAPAVFEFFIRKLPKGRNFLIAAGLEQVVNFLQSAKPDPRGLQWLKDSGRFSSDLIDYLDAFAFAGDLHAIPEGTAVFPNEPILRVSAPLPVAQLLETRLINLMHTSVLAASKAARMRLAAPDKTLVDFGFRRAHGAEAGLLAARASYLAGFTATATVPGASLWGIPLAGTMAHSYIEAHADEVQAFLDFARSRPNDVILLIDTYDTERAARRVVDIAPQLRSEGIEIKGVRVDSGDLAEMSRKVRAILDQGGLSDVLVLVSGGLDEWKLRDLVASAAPIDGFGIGTALTTSEDAPALDCAYKLQEYAGEAKRKLSSGKATYPGRKQVWRTFTADGRMSGDTLSLEDDDIPGTPLVEKIMEGGRLLQPQPTLATTRAHAAEQLKSLPETLKGLEQGPEYPVRVADRLEREAEVVARRIAAQTGT